MMAFAAGLTASLIQEIKDELKGKDLVCFCAPKLCHGEVLLRIANGTEERNVGQVLSEDGGTDSQPEQRSEHEDGGGDSSAG